MQKGYTDSGPWHGNQVQTGPVLIRGYSESGHDVVIQVVHIRIGVGAEWKRTRSDGSRVWKGASQGGRQRGDKRKEGKREVVP